MFGATDPSAFWLNMTNLGLGLLVVVCWVLVIVGVVCGVLDRRKRRLGIVLQLGDHPALRQLGATAADGGAPRNWSELLDAVEHLDPSKSGDQAASKPHTTGETSA